MRGCGSEIFRRAGLNAAVPTRPFSGRVGPGEAGHGPETGVGPTYTTERSEVELRFTCTNLAQKHIAYLQDTAWGMRY